MLKKTFKTASLSLIVLSGSLLASTAQATQKVGYINTAQIFQSLPQREVVSQKLQNEFKDKTAELKNIEADANKKIEKLKRDGALLSTEEVEKLRIDVSQLESKFKIKAQALDKAHQAREAEETQKLLKIIEQAVDKVAKADGYDLVLDVQAIRYSKPEYNLSEKVIKQLK